MNYREFYTELGKLMYAIAKADTTIEPAEVKELKRIVKEELTRLDESTDQYDSDAAFATEFEFEILEDWDVPANEAFDDFRSYISRTPDLSPFFKKVVYHSALRIANSFHNTNKSESRMLNDLRELLQPKEIPTNP